MILNIINPEISQEGFIGLQFTRITNYVNVSSFPGNLSPSTFIHIDINLPNASILCWAQDSISFNEYSLKFFHFELILDLEKNCKNSSFSYIPQPTSSNVIILYNHSTMIITRKLVLVQYY